MTKIYLIYKVYELVDIKKYSCLKRKNSALTLAINYEIIFMS